VAGRSEYVTDQELYIYMGLCKSRGLNPFIKDCHLVKYTPNEAAAIITSIDYYRKRARAQKDCRGWKTGIIVLKAGSLVYREGCIVLTDEQLVGGWCEGQPEGWAYPMRKEVNLKRYIKKTKDGAVTRFWSEENQPEMIAKVAESQLLRALWPDEFQGLYVDSEIQSQAAQATMDDAVSTHSPASQQPGDPPAGEFDQGGGGPDFDEIFKAELADPLFQDYIAASAKDNRLGASEIKALMLEQAEQVHKGFITFREKMHQRTIRRPEFTPATAPAQPPQQQPADKVSAALTFRDEWINLRISGFSTYVWKNMDRFKQADPALQAEAAAKWRKLYPANPWPLDPEPNDTQAKNSYQPQGEAIGAGSIPGHAPTPESPATAQVAIQGHISATPNEEMRVRMISECQAYGPEICQLAKKAMGVSEADSNWPPTISGVSRLFDECVRIEGELKASGR
jgi:phage recombination protein Bet